MLLWSRSLSAFASRIQAMVIINRQDVQLANDIRTMRDETTAAVALTEEKAAEMTGLQDQITQQRERLAAQKARYAQRITATQVAISGPDDVLNEAAPHPHNQL